MGIRVGEGVGTNSFVSGIGGKKMKLEENLTAENGRW